MQVRYNGEYAREQRSYGCSKCGTGRSISGVETYRTVYRTYYSGRLYIFEQGKTYPVDDILGRYLTNLRYTDKEGVIRNTFTEVPDDTEATYVKDVEETEFHIPEAPKEEEKPAEALKPSEETKPTPESNKPTEPKEPEVAPKPVEEPKPPVTEEAPKPPVETPKPAEDNKSVTEEPKPATPEAPKEDVKPSEEPHTPPTEALKPVEETAPTEPPKPSEEQPTDPGDGNDYPPTDHLD